MKRAGRYTRRELRLSRLQRFDNLCSSRGSNNEGEVTVSQRVDMQYTERDGDACVVRAATSTPIAKASSPSRLPAGLHYAMRAALLTREPRGALYPHQCSAGIVQRRIPDTCCLCSRENEMPPGRARGRERAS